MFSGNTSFIGLDNYIRMFESEEFWSVLKNTARVSFIRSASGERD
jgi:ABC-type sugar transport system permease subunit